MVMERTAAAAALADKLDTRTATVGVMGLGYAGLPMAVALGEAGFTVIGLDVDEARASAVAAGRSPVSDVSDASIRALRQARLLDATTDMRRLSDCDVVLVAVPTPLGPAKAPDLGYVRSAGESLARNLHPGMLVVLQSTVTPRTTRDVLGGILAQRTSLEVGKDYFLAFCPERIDPGNQTWHVENTPKLVGGITPTCTELAARFYGPVCQTIVQCSSPEVAEFSKLVENTFRFINISFVNELSVLCDRLGVSVWEVIDAAATKPFAFQPHYPGPGVGGHCIPVVPFQLEALAREHGLVSELVEVSGRINSEQPRFVARKLLRLLGQQEGARGRPKVLCIGVTYKADVADLRESAALRVLEELIWQGAQVRYWDPFFTQVRVDSTELRSVDLNDAALSWADAVVLLVAHSQVDYRWLVAGSRLVLDTANRLKGIGEPHVVPL
jgi:UDP-N-acetyl-D-glucosamine dehydrogenase